MTNSILQHLWFLAIQDTERGVGWEQFEFNKDAPHDDEEIGVQHVEDRVKDLLLQIQQGQIPWSFHILNSDQIFQASSMKDSSPINQCCTFFLDFCGYLLYTSL